MAIIAFQTVIEDPTFMRRYGNYVATESDGLERAKIIEELEKSLASVYGGAVQGGNKKLVPDVTLGGDFSKTLSEYFGEGPVTETELKLGRVSGRRKTTIGQSRITDTLKSAALEQFGSKAADLTKKRVSTLNRNKGAKLFEALKSDPKLFNEFYRKSRFLNLAKQSGNGPVTVTSILIPKSDFKIPPLNIRYSASQETIFLSLDSPFERALINEVSNKPLIRISEAKASAFIEGFEKLKNKSSYATLRTRAKKDNEFKIIIPTGGSIPLVTAKVKTKKRKSSERLKTISDLQLTSLVQRETERRMPKGPKRGEPLSPTVLTYRTGQFVDSIKVVQSIRQQLITYYYAPNYRVHEKRGARAPRFLLQASIRETVKQVYGTRFRIIRGF